MESPHDTPMRFMAPQAVYIMIMRCYFPVSLVATSPLTNAAYENQISRSINELINQSDSQSKNQYTNQSFTQSMNQSNK